MLTCMSGLEPLLYQKPVEQSYVALITLLAPDCTRVAPGGRESVRTHLGSGPRQQFPAAGGAVPMHTGTHTGAWAAALVGARFPNKQQHTRTHAHPPVQRCQAPLPPPAA